MQPPSKSDRDLFYRLDHHDPRLYWTLSIMATIGGFLFGYDTSNIGSVLSFVPYHLGVFATGYLVAGASLGAAAGAVAAGPVTDRFGRKSLLVTDAAIYALGAILSAFTVNVTMLLIARTLIGLAIGADSAIATAYIAEYAPKNRRGKLAILQQWMITIGIFGAYVLAIMIYSAWPSAATTWGWRLILGLGAVPATIGLMYRMRMPESPRWLLQKGHFQKLQKALEILGISASLDEIHQAAQRPVAGGGENPSPWTQGIKRAFFVAAIFMVFQQITGINIPFYYGPKILQPFFAHPHESAVRAAVSGIEATLVLAVVNIAATYIGFHNIDKAGRRSLSRMGFMGMAGFMVFSAATLAFLHGMIQAAILLITLAGFIVFFAFGVGGTGWIIEGEYFPTEVRGRMASAVATVNWLANFAVVQAFPVLKNLWGLAGVMVLFAVLSVFAVGFISRWMPETKGLSLEEITQLFDKLAQPK